MSIFLDTGVFVAFHNQRDENHQRANELITAVVNGEFGAAFTSDYVFDEAVTVALMRTGRSDLAVLVGKTILGVFPRPFLVMLKVDEQIFRSSWDEFMKDSKKGLSFTDCTSMELIRSRQIDKITSFDSGFDGLIERVH